MTTIIGVDFSGAKDDRGTWAAKGCLTTAGKLQLDDVRRIRRADLHELLTNITPQAVVAMDFPFSEPTSFATWLCKGRKPAAMPEVWQVVADMPQESFIASCAQFVCCYKDPQRAGVDPLPADTAYCHSGEPHRAGDAKYLSGPFSPLHGVRPSMQQMTYHGSCLLQRLHEKNPSGRWHVPPLPPTASPENTVTLLETMPGAFLRVYGLPHERYKNYRGEVQKRDRLMNREKILDGLGTIPIVPERDLAEWRHLCMQNHDCLDSVIAAVVAAMWVNHSTCCFRCPTAQDKPAAQREGWIYVPKRACKEHLD